MKYKRRRPRKKRTYMVEDFWSWRKSSKLDYRLKKEFKKKKNKNYWGLLNNQ